ncbi:MAG: hypothetical protein LBH25_08875 [Fibromonadaceae bacterium]|nr:hypothetical protein [Fibromonadaceae bacterium]
MLKKLEHIETMKNDAISFFLKDIENLKLFVKKMHNEFGQQDLAYALKMFVMSRNMVFNMAEYMKKQSESAEEYVKSQGKDFSHEEKHSILNNWIEKNAQQHRKQIILDQLQCIDEMAVEIVPAIEKALQE